MQGCSASACNNSLVSMYAGSVRDSCKEVLLQVSYSLLGPVYHLLEQHSAKRIDEAHLPDASVILYLRIAMDSHDVLRAALLDATSGQVTLEEIEV